MVIYKVAVIQLHPEVVAANFPLSVAFTNTSKPLQAEDNHRRACRYIREVASQGAVLAVLPE